MPIVVQKYGGTSVGDPERIRRVADRIARAREEGQDVVVVVSAMGQDTDELLEMAAAITPAPEPRELDMLLTACERIAMSLLAIAVNARGFRAEHSLQAPHQLAPRFFQLTPCHTRSIFRHRDHPPSLRPLI